MKLTKNGHEIANTNFLDDGRKKKYDLSNCHSQKKVKPVKVVNYNINAANCNVLNMVEFVHCLRNLHNQSTASCQQKICVNIEVKYFFDNIINHNPRTVYINFEKGYDKGHSQEIPKQECSNH